MKCNHCGHEADPICANCGEQGFMDEDDPMDDLTEEQKDDMAEWEENELDQACHDAASRIASDANNGGLEAQVRFLLAQGMTFDQINEARE